MINLNDLRDIASVYGDDLLKVEFPSRIHYFEEKQSLALGNFDFWFSTLDPNSVSNYKSMLVKVEIHGKKWFQKSYGNTYHSVNLVVNDKAYYIPFTYGYGEHYVHTAFEKLQVLGYFLNMTYQKFCYYMHNNKEQFVINGYYVPRKKDL